MNPKMLLFALMLFSTTTFVSCKKCKTCTQTITTTVNVPTPGYPQTSETTEEVCGKDLEEIDGKSVSSTSTNGGITATVTVSVTCS